MYTLGMDSPINEQKRSIQDIIPPARSKPLRPPPVISQTPLPPPPPTTRPNYEAEDGKRKYFFIVVAAIAILLAGLLVGVVSTVFHRAEVLIEPYSYTVDVNDTFTASLTDSPLTYTRVTYDETATRNVQATGSRMVDERATGTITVFNAYSTGSQRLITNTRFQTKEGLVYRVHAPVVVPGYTTKAGVKVPGSIDVVVYADVPGDSHNIGLSDFTLPGLKDPEQARLIYAKSKTPISGGFVGERAVVDDALRQTTVGELKAEVERALRAHIENTDERNVVFADSATIVYSEAPDRIENGEAVLTVTGTLVAPQFSRINLAKMIADAHNIQFGGELSVTEPLSLNVQIDSPQKAASGEVIEISILGSTVLKAVYDEAALVQSILGKTEADLTEIRASLPAIERMQLSIYPIWRNSVPSNPDKVTLKSAE